MEKQKGWCQPEREINPHTIFLKKMAHLLLHKCYIHIVISVPGTENSTSHCWFLMCINNTLKYLTQEEIFYQPTMKTEDGHRWRAHLPESGARTIPHTRLRATTLLCSQDAICKFQIIIDRLW